MSCYDVTRYLSSDQGVQLGQLSGHELNGVVGEVDLPAAPNKAVLELRLFP